MPIVGAIPRRLCALAFLALQACAQEEPVHVYVPADDYVISVQIALPAEARAGEWTRLSAQRRSGPWKRIRREAAPAGFVPFVKPPPEFESEVADNLFWMTEPPRSAYPTDAKSNVVTIRVR